MQPGRRLVKGSRRGSTSQASATKQPLGPSNATSTGSTHPTILSRSKQKLVNRTSPYPKPGPTSCATSNPPGPRLFAGKLVYRSPSFDEFPGADIVIRPYSHDTAYRAVSAIIDMHLPGLISSKTRSDSLVTADGLPVYLVAEKVTTLYPLLLLAHSYDISPTLELTERQHVCEIIKAALKSGAPTFRLGELTRAFSMFLADTTSLHLCAQFVDSVDWDVGKDLVAKAALKLKDNDMKAMAEQSPYFYPKGSLGSLRADFIEEHIRRLMYNDGGLHLPFLSESAWIWFRCSHGKTVDVFLSHSAQKVPCCYYFYEYCCALLDALTTQPSAEMLLDRMIEFDFVAQGERHCKLCSCRVAADLRAFHKLLVRHFKIMVKSLNFQW